MNNKEFTDKALEISKKYKTSYMLGAFGFPCTNKNIKRLLNQYEDNYAWLKSAENIVGQGFLFDCVGLIKSILWGFNGSFGSSYGGAIYASNGVPDIDADTMIKKCSGVTKNFSNIQIGEVVWMSGHIGIYVGNLMVVECTPSFNGGVQVTSLGNVGSVAGLNSRIWTYHGKLPWVSYTSTSASTPPQQQVNYKQAAPARYFSEGYAGIYTVSANIGVNVRVNAGTDHAIIKAIPYGSKVQNYGYYSLDKSGKVWLYVKLNNGIIGYICKDFLI